MNKIKLVISRSAWMFLLSHFWQRGIVTWLRATEPMSFDLLHGEYTGEVFELWECSGNALVLGSNTCICRPHWETLLEAVRRVGN